MGGEKGVRLAQAINDYGYHTQLWLSHEHGFTLGDGEGDAYAKMKGAYTTTYDDDTVKSKVNKHKIISDLNNSDITVTYRLHLDTTTGISVRLKPNSGRITSLQANLGISDNKQPDGTHIVRLNGIPAHQLADRLEVTGTTSSGNRFSVNVCALSYVRTVFASSGSSQLAKNAMGAFLEYYEAEINYREGGTS